MTSIFLSPMAARMTVNSVCSSTGAAAARRGRSGGYGDRGGGGDAPLLLEELGELGGFENRQRGEFIDDLFEIGHVECSLDMGSN